MNIMNSIHFFKNSWREYQGLAYRYNIENLLHISSHSKHRTELLETLIANFDYRLQDANWQEKIIVRLCKDTAADRTQTTAQRLLQDRMIARLICLAAPADNYRSQTSSRDLHPLVKAFHSCTKGFFQHPAPFSFPARTIFEKIILSGLEQLPSTCHVLIKRLRWEGEITRKNQPEASPLALAAQASHNFCQIVTHFGDAALIHAASEGRYRIAKLLIKSGANVNAAEPGGWTVSMLAAFYGHFSTLRLLIDHGANLHLVNDDGQGIVDLVKSARPSNYTRIVNLLYSTCPKLRAQSKEYTCRKAVAHAWHLAGISVMKPTFDAPSIKIQLEGSLPRRWFHLINKDLKHFQSSFPFIFSKAQYHLLKDALSFAVQQAGSCAIAILERVHSKLPTLVEIGFTGHSVILLIWKNQLAICNRGEASRRPLEIFHYDIDKLTPKIIDKLIDLSELPRENYQTYLFYELPAKLGFSKWDVDIQLEKALKLPMQSVGNCSWVSTITAIHAFMLIDATHRVVKTSQEIKQLTAKSLHLIQNQHRRRYGYWLAYQQISFLQKLIHRMSLGERDYEPDHELIIECLAKARAYRLDSHNASRLKTISEKYFNLLNKTQRPQLTTHLALKFKQLKTSKELHAINL